MVTAARTNHPQQPLRRTRPSDDGDSPFIWREALWGLDWLSLRLSPVYLGIGVPHGDGSPVILVPGFLTTDAYMVEMYFWLRRVGYSPFLSGIGVNADCIQTLTQRLEHRRREPGSPGVCLSSACECFTPGDEVHCPPPSVHHAALYSRDDGVIDRRDCLEPEPSLNHEVGGTHIGLG